MNRLIKKIDPVLLLLIAGIFIIALLALFSASHKPDGSIPKNYCIQQIIWMIVALIVSALFVWTGYERWLDYSYLIFGFNILLLILVLLIGDVRLGARRWLSLGLFSLQPSELCKISFMLVLAKYVGERDRVTSLRGVITALLICLLPMLLIMKQPDLGTAIVFLPIFFIGLFIAGAKKRHLLAIMVGGLGILPILWSALKPYQKQRLMVFMNPNIDPLGAGYTIIQSKIAIGSGGFFGKGWLAGTQNHLNFLPERHTDFIFSVIGEEWGFFGAIILLCILFFILRRLLSITEETSDVRGRVLVAGAVTLIWFQVLVNISMTIGLMPVVGLPLPFISYGGSNLMTTMVLVALAISVSLKRKIF